VFAVLPGPNCTLTSLHDLEALSDTQKPLDGMPTDVPIVQVVKSSESAPDHVMSEFAPNHYSPLLKRHGPLHFVVSTGSGSRIARRFFLLTVFPLLGLLGLAESLDYEAHFTESQYSVSDLTKSLFIPIARAGRSVLKIVLLSGDGGIVDVVNTIYRYRIDTEHWVKPQITILPFGTGNALSNSYNYLQDQTYGLSAMMRGLQRPLPVFRVTCSPGSRLLVNESNKGQPLPVQNQRCTLWGAVVCSWGLHASLVGDSDTSHYRRFGPERFRMAANALLYPEDGSAPHKYRGRVAFLPSESYDWRIVPRTEHSYVLATLVSHLERGFNISPDSQSLDGRMRLIEMPNLSGDDISSVLAAAYRNGEHLRSEHVGYHEIEGLRIDVDEEDPKWRRICVDGKIIQLGKGGWVQVEREHRNLLDVLYMPPKGRT